MKSVEVDASIRIRSAVPTFLVRDVGATLQWYAQELAFQIGGTFPKSEPYAYASLRRGGAEIMLLRLADFEKPDLSSRRPEGLWDAYIRMSGVRELYDSVVQRGCIKMSLRKQPYGDWEFEVRDPNGYVLVFGGDADRP